MYLETLNLYNFRKFSKGDQPGLTVKFNDKLNLLVGENDSGKTAIIDGIRYLLGVVSDEYIKIQNEDFYRNEDGETVTNFQIEGVFADLSEQEAGAFLEWLSIKEDTYELRVYLTVDKITDYLGKETLDFNLKAGPKGAESRLEKVAKEILKTTYLKPLRDASQELKPGLRSRLAQILRYHPALKKEVGEEHQLETVVKDANSKIENFFGEIYQDEKSIVTDLKELLKNFFSKRDSDDKVTPVFEVAQTDLNDILRKLGLTTKEINNGLGSLNVLFIATELLLLNIENNMGPNITLIEEIEAHLHPQAQYRLIKYIELQLKKAKANGQFIITTHSPSLAASISPEYIVQLYEENAYELSKGSTMLEDEDYEFLKRFLDATKSNLFFAKGIIFVEGDSESLLIPVIAELIGLPLHEYGISIVNVNGTSFERYIKLFSRADDGNKFKLPVSVITDLDIKPWIYYEKGWGKDYYYSIETKKEYEEIKKNISKEIGFNEDLLGRRYNTAPQLLTEWGFKGNDFSEADKKEVIKIIAKAIDEDYLTEKITRKKSDLCNKYSIYNAEYRLCIAKEWTLEYCLAKSCLSVMLIESIFECRYKKPTKVEQQEKEDLIAEIQGGVSDEKALEIFKPVHKKNVSKAEVAQVLGYKLLNDSSKNLGREILKDTYLKYIVEAIQHASGVDIDD
ncbi:ATP-dependent nuclease [Bacillus sp. FJAT-52991]|uniref:AAA family ATPase n=1 Tax=Bacillus kandeliae TaxID=3129297 RepID=A0ABZ2N739_9BACI